MNIISTFLIAFAMLFSVLSFFGLIIWLIKGGINIVLPGLGLVITLPFMIVLLLISQMFLVLLAVNIHPSKNKDDKNQFYKTEKKVR